MMTMKKILLAGACAGLLALGAASASAAGPIMPAAMNQAVNSNAVQNVEWQWDPLQGHNVWVAPRPYYYAPGNSQWGRSHAPWYGKGNSNWGNYRYSPPGHRRYYQYHPGYWRR